MDSILYVLGELFNHISEILVIFGLAFISVVVKHVQAWLKARPLRRFERGLQQNAKVRDLLAELRVLYDADRVGLWQFSNGNYYVSGESIMNTSLTHFVTKTGVASPTIVRPIPTTHMLPTLKLLQADKSGLFPHDLSTDDSFQEVQFAATGTAIFIAAAVRDARKGWVGILIVSWLECPPGESDDKNLLSYAHQIGEFITKKD